MGNAWDLLLGLDDFLSVLSTRSPHELIKSYGSLITWNCFCRYFGPLKKDFIYTIHENVYGYFSHA